ncbi:DUF4468 domain-containing protein [Pedobacter sp. BMA]|uniref:DUF4468 domain-containing protein n=1 Tax=Pedobacter sp. BMA TaxID=1663685 RepID=UPI00064A6036|nr:DUF4468 domain-containing protein [Pedobacter sp. BMA]KLT65835.1 hypothetical protein AB669_06450 [Pedobacter sp. BMA]
MRSILVVLFSICSLCLFAQQKNFSKDDQGKFIYYKVVDSVNLNKQVLTSRASKFVNDFYKKQLKQSSATDSSVLATGKVVIDKTLLVAGHPSGEVSYQFIFEARDDKYRFWLTDFSFVPYKRDRYGNFVASTTISTPLEKPVGKLNAGEWTAIQESAYSKAVKFAEDFRKYLATELPAQPKPKKTETISTKKW